MDNQSQVYQYSLQAFTEIFAIVSHELRNTLAIINENSGLLDDLILMSNETIESRRVKIATAAIEKQVSRSDKIIKTMNRFAHTADLTVSTAVVQLLLTDIVDLTNRKAAGAEITVEIKCDKNHTLTGELPVIEATVYYILSSAYSFKKPLENKRIVLQVSTFENAYEILFQTENFTIEMNEDTKQKVQQLCEYINGEFVAENDYSIRLPKTKQL